MVSKICDIHLLICEIAVKMIEEYNGDLQHNAIFRVQNDTKAELGKSKHNFYYTFNKNLKFFDKRLKLKEKCLNLVLLGISDSCSFSKRNSMLKFFI